MQGGTRCRAFEVLVLIRFGDVEERRPKLLEVAMECVTGCSHEQLTDEIYSRA